MKILVVGSGISGCSAARLLRDKGHCVTVMECRPHSGGNCHDETWEGVKVHKYGPHLFHTSDPEVWSFLSQFTEWTDYRHRVVADTRLGRISIPYNQTTEDQIGKPLSDEEIRELIFVDYSEKQWGVKWHELPKSITGRVPTRRTNADNQYFTDVFQGQPKQGYAKMFEQMLAGISISTDLDKQEWRRLAGKSDLVIYTGKIDEYFDCRLGRLPYRSLRFKHILAKERLPHAVINQCNRLPFTRIYDHRWFSQAAEPEIESGLTVITQEYPMPHDPSNEPYYPMPFGKGMALYQAYRKLADAETRTIFLGRLATFSYLDMWMAVAQAMKKLRTFL